MKPRHLVALSALGLVLLLAACASSRAEKRGTPTISEVPGLILISVDGLRPDFYRSDTFKADAPALRALAASGSSARGMQPIFPTLTYPNHTSLVTGRTSEAHGVYNNTILSAEKGPTHSWYWNESYVKTPTLWQLAKHSGKSVAILRWPASVGARVDWLLPEIFYSPGIDVARDWGLISQKTDPHFLEEIRGMSDFHPPVTVPDLDRLTSTVAKNLLDEESPDLTLIHLVGADYAQHLSGIDSPQTHAAVREIDRQVAEIVHAADLSRRVVMITGDHGFKNYRKALAINALLADKGWLKASHGAIESWSAVAQPDGGGAAIYAKTPELGEQVRTLLLQEAKGRFRIIDHPQLSALHSFPDAAFAVVAEEGYIFSDDLTGAFEKELPGTKGHHGYLPNDPKMQTGLIVAGMGIRPGLDLGYVRVLDVAPTVADLIGIPGEIPGAEGRPLPIRALSERAPTPKVPGKLLDNVD